ncbi:cytospin-A isoform X1 [Clarias gariepinus]|uniref:cytospin-A isoform X1 n=1 Tax=Clarias gariepinus TaxID=13013 RepID=UPI00234CC4A3|nr:cytospin-A isoform X1 [Clarias gariepinus]
MGNNPGKERQGSIGTADAFQTPPTSPTSSLPPVLPGNAQLLPSPTHTDPTPSPEATHSPTATGPDGCLSSDGVRYENRKASVSLQKPSDGSIIPCEPKPNSTSTSPVQVETPSAVEGEVEQGLLHECVVSLGLCVTDEKTHTLSDLLRCFLTEREQMKDELRSLKEKMQTDHSEWLQFQSDLQVALVVADRMRAEAEEELSVLRAARENWERQLTNSQQGQREVEGQVERLKAELEQRKQRTGQRLEPPSQQGATEGCARITVGKQGDEQRTGEEKRKEKVMETTEKLKKQSASPSSLLNGTSQTPLALNTNPLNKNNNLTTTTTRERPNMDQQDNLINLYKVDKKEDNPTLHLSPVIDLSPNKTSKIKPQEDFSKLLRRHGGSKRNSLLRWSQNRTSGYKNIEITNFSSSWMDGLAFCAVYHSYLPSHIPYNTLRPENKRENLLLAFRTGESVGIAASLTADEMLRTEGPDWQRVLGYVESIYRHFEM